MGADRDLTLALKLADELSGPFESMKQRLRASAVEISQSLNSASASQAATSMRQWAASVQDAQEQAARLTEKVAPLDAQLKLAAAQALQLDSAFKQALSDEKAAKLDKIKTAARDVGTQLASLAGAALGKGGQSILGDIGKLGAITGIAAAGYELAAFLKSGIEGANELAKSLAGAFTIVDKGTISFGELKRKVLDLSDAFGVAQTEAGAAASVLLTESTKRTQEEVDLLLTASAKLSKVGLIPLTQSAQLLTDILDAYQKSAADANRVTSLLFVGAKNAGVSVQELGELLRRVGPLAQTTGVGIEEIASVLGVLRDRGVSAQGAIYGLSTIMLALSGRNNPVIDSLRAQGVELDLNTLKTKGLVEQLRVLEAATRENAQAQITLFGSPRIASAISTMLQASKDELGKRVEDLQDAERQTDEVLLRIQNKISEKTARVAEKFERFKTEVGQGFKSAIASLIPDEIALPEASVRKAQEQLASIVTALKTDGIDAALSKAEDVDKARKTAIATADSIGSAFIEAFTKLREQNKALLGEDATLGTFFDGMASGKAKAQLAEKLKEAFTLNDAQATQVIDKIEEKLRAVFENGELPEDMSGEFGAQFKQTFTAILASILPTLRQQMHDTALEALNSGASAVDLTHLLPTEEKLSGFERDADGKLRPVWRAVIVEPITAELSKAQTDVSDLLSKFNRTVVDKLAPPPVLGLDDATQKSLDRLRAFVDAPAAGGIKQVPADVAKAAEAIKAFIAQEDALRGAVLQSEDDFLTGTEKEIRHRELAIEKLKEQLAAANQTAPSYARLSAEIDRQTKALDDFRIATKAAADASAAAQARQFEELFSPVKDAAAQRNTAADAAAKERDATERASRELERSIEQIGNAGLSEFERQRARVSQVAAEAIRKLSEAAATHPEITAQWTDIFDEIAAAASKAFDAIDAAELAHNTAEVRTVLTDITRIASEGLPGMAREWATVNAQIEAQKANLDALKDRLDKLPKGTPGVAEARERISALIAGAGQQASDDFTVQLLSNFDLNATSLRDELLVKARPIIEDAKKALDDLAKRPDRAPQLLRYLDDLADRLRKVKIEAQDTAERFQQGFSKGVSDRILEFTDAWKRGFDLATRSIDAFASEASSAITDMATGVKREGGILRSFLQGLARDLAQIASDLLVRSLLGKLLGSFAGGGGTSINGPLPFSTTFATGGLILGGLTPTTALRSYAGGGEVRGPQIALIGDNRAQAEAIVPLPGPGRGIPVEFPKGIAIGGGGTTINLHFSASVHAIDTQTMATALQQQARLIGDIAAHQITSGTNRSVRVAIRSVR